MRTTGVAATALAIGGPFALGLGLLVLAAVLTTGSRAQRALGFLVGLSTMLPSWLVPSEYVQVRGLWALCAFCGVMRCSDLRFGSWTLRARLIHVVSVVDTRRLVRTRPFIDVGGLVVLAGWWLLTVPAYYAVSLRAYASPAATTDWLARWFFGLVFVYALSEGAYVLLRVAYRAAGFLTPPLHILPAASRSVQEFWGERWNRTVGIWLAETFFRPLARRRRPLLGALAAFTASAIVHAYLAWVAVGPAMAACMLAFFVAQALIIFVERALDVRAWAPWAGRVWTLSWMTALSPLFTEGFMRVIRA